MHSINSVLKDFFDKGASKSTSVLAFKEVWSGLILVFSSIINFIDPFTKITNSYLGLSSGLIPVIITLLGIWFSLHIIIYKETSQIKNVIGFNKKIENFTNYSYMYNNTFRNLAKFFFIVFLIIIPFYSYSAWMNFMPLPKTIYGYVFNEKDNTAIQDAIIKIKTKDGVDITNGLWVSDNNGFYVVTASENIKRDYTINVIVDNCEEIYNLKLNNYFEIKDSLPLNPIFRHYITICSHE